MLHFLDIFFVVFHTILVFFNLFGWAWRRTRRIHLYSILLTFASWTLLGVIFTFGYCPFTDWHWDIKRKLGETDLPASYIKYYLDAISPFEWNPATVDMLVLVSSLTALGLSIRLNLRDRRRKAEPGVERAD